MPRVTFGTSDSWICPAGVTSIQVECWGAGGTGADAVSDAVGGGGGAYARKTISVTPDETYAIEVGIAGDSMYADSYFGDRYTVLAAGASINYPGLASNSIGDQCYSGGAGQTSADGVGGGGGSSAGTNADGNAGGPGQGEAGTAPAGGGDGGPHQSAGSAPGGGGGGGDAPEGLGALGGAGRVVLSWNLHSARISFAEMETPEEPPANERRARVSFAEMETPPSPVRASLMTPTQELGDRAPASVIDFKFNTTFANGEPATLAGAAVAAYKANGAAEDADGLTLTVDFDGLTGLHHLRIDTSADPTFYAADNDFQIVLTAGTVDGLNVSGQVLAAFSLSKQTAALTSSEREGAADALLDRADTIEIGWTLRQVLRILSAVLAGKLSGVAAGAPVFRNLTDTTNRVSATTSSDGRTSVSYDAT